MSWIETSAPDEMPQGKINKLKGMAMESAIQEMMDRVDSQFSSSEDVDQLVEDVNRLQDQVAELNGGEEDYFMDLQQVEEVKA